MTFRVMSSKSYATIVSEWDALAELRHTQISSGIDITYTKLLCPSISGIIREKKPANILDAGCGVGILTEKMSSIAQNVVGIDPSSQSIEIAKRFHSNVKTTFLAESIESFRAKMGMARFDAVVANMVLMDTLDLDSFLLSSSVLLKDDGYFAFSITHPCFWPEYYGYSSETWFSYEKELIIEGPFRTSLSGPGQLVSTHIHRPLSNYSEKLQSNGFVVERLFEPLPSAETLSLYPKSWIYPRYMVGLCKKATT